MSFQNIDPKLEKACYSFHMDEHGLAYMERFFMALADRTRLRILNLMRDEEVCVAYFTDVLEISQPKASRHLAYLRNTGIAGTRREGKWMHYSIEPPQDPLAERMLWQLFEWFDSNEELWQERQRYLSMRRESEPVSTAFDKWKVDGSGGVHNELEEFLL